jgi:hypothetical protein
MKQLKVGPVQTMVGSALGTVAAAAFSLWAGRLRIYPPYVAGLDVLITGTVVIATNYLASVILDRPGEFGGPCLPNTLMLPG